MKLLVTGCAKSGTTLLTRLMTAYDLTVNVDTEMSIKQFVQSNYDCAKRDCNTLLSSHRFTKDRLNWSGATIADWNTQLKLLSNDNLSVLHIVRNKTDVLLSDNGWVSPERYDAVKWQSEELASLITVEVKYEELCKFPDKVQKQVEIGLKMIPTTRKWSDYHKWYEPTENEIQTGIYAVRPIG